MYIAKLDAFGALQWNKIDVNLVNHGITLKFNSSGILQWSRKFYSGGARDGFNDIVLDREGNVVEADKFVDTKKLVVIK